MMSFMTLIFSKIIRCPLELTKTHRSLLFNHNNVCGQNFNERFQHTKPIKCWKCGIERQSISELFCQQCKIIQNPGDTNNYFKILQQNEIFDIDFKILRDKYRHMQSILHPDKFSNRWGTISSTNTVSIFWNYRSTEEKNISEDFSSLVNKAYDTLQSPLKRALHLLCLKGEKINEDEKINDSEFLMEIMEINEEVQILFSVYKNINWLIFRWKMPLQRKNWEN